VLDQYVITHVIRRCKIHCVPLRVQEDYVELDGVRIDKPFVEKPASGEDHNIHIYYPHSMVSVTQHPHLLPTQHGECNATSTSTTHTAC
jgi:hypothetical protein